MEAAELVEWQALYLEIEPLPESRADLRTGITVVNGLAPYMKKGAALPSPADVMPQWDGEPSKPKQTIEQMKAIWGQAERAFNRKRKK